MSSAGTYLYGFTDRQCQAPPRPWHPQRGEAGMAIRTTLPTSMPNLTYLYSAPRAAGCLFRPHVSHPFHGRREAAEAICSAVLTNAFHDR